MELRHDERVNPESRIIERLGVFAIVPACEDARRNGRGGRPRRLVASQDPERASGAQLLRCAGALRHLRAKLADREAQLQNLSWERVEAN